MLPIGKWKKKHHFEVELFEKFVAFLRLSLLLQPNHLYLLECILLSWHCVPLLHLCHSYSHLFTIGCLTEQCEQNENEIEPNINMNDREKKKSIQTNLKVRFFSTFVYARSPSCLLSSSHYSRLTNLVIPEWWRHFIPRIAVPKYHQNDGRRCENVVFQLFGFPFIAFHVLTLCERSERNRFVILVVLFFSFVVAVVVVYLQDFAGIFISR